MNLNNELISNWIYERFQKDYFLFDRICSTPRIIHFELTGNSLIVEYEFWDDGHANTDDQEFFIFDLEIGNEYGINYPAKLQLVKIKEKYTWKSLHKSSTALTQALYVNETNYLCQHRI
jgi:hypothetical protein